MFKWLIFSDFAAAVLLRDFITEARTALTAYASEEAAALVSRLCEELLGVTSYAHIVHPELEIPEASLPVLQAALGRLADGEPLQYVLGYTDFLGMRLRVSPAVLIPRPETEELCRRVISACNTRFTPALSAPPSGTRSRPGQGATACKAPRAILDLCCGSGCITWAMARAFPDALVVGVDLSAAALEVARGQCEALSSSSSPSFGRTPVFLQADVLDVPALENTLQEMLARYGPDAFDLLLSNPPYVRESEKRQMRRNVLEHEPSMALFVPDSHPLLFYQAIEKLFSGPLFLRDALMALEINENLGGETRSLFAKKYAYSAIEKDFFEKDRYLFVKK